MKGKGLFVFSDPAGAKAALAKAYFLRAEGKLSEHKAISDRDYEFFLDFGIEVTKHQEGDEAEFLEKFKPDFVFTGTSYTSRIEIRVIKEALRRGVYSIAFIDHWVNFRNRFLLNDEVIFPDEIWVVDQKAKHLSIEEGLPEHKLLVTGNPYHEFLKSWRPSINKKNFLQILGLTEDASYVLYVPEPLSQVGGREKFGFDEFDVLEKVRSEFHNRFEKKCLLIKPHPNHILEKFTTKISLSENIKLVDPKISINSLMFYAEKVIGIFSNALIEAEIIGAKVERIIPETCKSEFRKIV